MARLVYIAGSSGSGKSTSLMTLNPETSFILNADNHELPFAYKDRYNEKNENYIEGSSISIVKTAIKQVNENKKMKVLVIDTFSRVMTDYIMSKPFRAATDGRKAWGKFAQDMYDLLDIVNNGLRPDLTVYFLAHTEQFFSESGILKERIAVHGQQLSKFSPESFSTVVLYTTIEVIPGQKPSFYFKTVTSGVDTCKSPIGMFEEDLVPNDLKLITETLNKYYN